MILMVHNNGGSPKWWAKEGKFGRGSAMWGPIEYMHLGKTCLLYTSDAADE